MLQVGPGLKAGQYVINLELDTGKGSSFPSRLVPFGTVIAADHWKVSEFKEHIFSSWADLYSSFRCKLTEDMESFTTRVPETLNHLRLRDVTGICPILRDDRILPRVLLGLTDGKKVAIQVLNTTETIGKADTVLYSRFLSFQKKKIWNVLDGAIVMKKDYTTSDLLRAVLSLYFSDPSDVSLSVAKGYPTGKPN
jgi:hypothetical protein